MDGILLRDVTIIDANSSYHNKTVDVLIEKGVYSKIAKKINYKGNAINRKGCILTNGLTDLRAFVQDPGEEYKESFASMNNVALAGGFTTVCIHPHGPDSLQRKQDIEYINTINKSNVVNFVPIAACTVGIQGTDVSEMYDMKLSGAMGVSNGNNVIAHAGIMNRILQYTANIDSTIFIHAQLDYMVPNWQVSEGFNNLKTGLKGLPNIAESIMVNRDIALAQYNDTKIHFSHISTAESVELIRKAKAIGIKVTADASIMHLLFNDENTLEFDSNFKCNPPLRSRKDQMALIQGLKDGTLDAICTDHYAQDKESKIVEFDHADYGVISSQWAFAKAYEKLALLIGKERLIALFTSKPRKIVGLKQQEIKIGNQADFMVFCEDQEWQFNAASNKSKSSNCPFMEQTIKGKVVASGVGERIKLY